MNVFENFHTHIYLCKHATGNVEDYAKKAIELGYKTLGISDHGPLSEHYLKQFNTRRMSYDEYHNIYLKELNDAKKKFKDKITLLSAVEIEYYSDMHDNYQKMLEELDYLILGQHKIIKQDGSIIKIYNSKGKDDLLDYTENIINGLNSGFFSILAHPDIFMIFYKKWDNLAILCSKKIIETAINNNVVLEINANGIRKELLKNNQELLNYSYPKYDFWELVKHYPKAKVIISEDTHHVEDLCDEATIKAYQLAHKLNLQLDLTLKNQIINNKFKLTK